MIFFMLRMLLLTGANSDTHQLVIATALGKNYSRNVVVDWLESGL